jgi:hypothetical protein
VRAPAIVALILGVACGNVSVYTELVRGRPEEAAGGCRLELSATESPLLDIHGRVNLPKGVWLTGKTVDFYKESDVAKLVDSPCRTYALYGSFNAIDPVDRSEEFSDGIVATALGVPRDRVTWSEITVAPTRFTGAYEYRDWYPRDVPPRKGWVTLRVLKGVAYYFLLETNQQYWDSVSDTFKKSAETAVFTAAMGQGPSALDDDAVSAAD